MDFCTDILRISRKLPICAALKFPKGFRKIEIFVKFYELSLGITRNYDVTKKIKSSKTRYQRFPKGSFHLNQIIPTITRTTIYKVNNKLQFMLDFYSLFTRIASSY